MINHKQTELERLVNHPLFLQLKEFETFFEVTMKSKEANRNGGSNYYDVDLKRIVPEETYTVFIQKK